MAEKKHSSGHSYKEAVLKSLLKQAVAGSSWAIQEVLNRMDGRPAQRIQQDVTTGGEMLNASVSFVGASPIVNSLPIANTSTDDTIQAIEAKGEQVVEEGKGSA
jgi:phosphopantetheinyl transferase (holo-ACP synthase)